MLQGAKVTLRALEPEDLARLHLFNNDLAVELAGGGDPPWPQSLARLRAEYDSRTQSGGRDGTPEGVNFAIEATDTALFIGICGLFNYDSTAMTCEVGITIGDRQYWGRGYGRDALRLLLDYAFRCLNRRRVFLRVNARNERGIRAYRAVGFCEEGRLREHVWNDGSYDDLVLMGVLRREWEQLQGQEV